MLKNVEVTIRPTDVSDSEAIADILQESGCISFSNDKVDNRFAKNIAACNADDSHTILVAEDGNGKVVGYIGVHWLHYLMSPDTRGYVSELYVRQEARGRGIGRKLLDAVREQAVARGCSRLMVINVRNRITYPRRFFLNLSWEERPEVTNLILPLLKKS
jgi:ribosomal protein S18 acetylase RimI-like enzyme